MIRVAVDAMGGDNAPVEIVKGAVAAIRKSDEVSVILVGREKSIRSALRGHTFDPSRLTIVNAEEVIDMHDHPAMAIRSKKDSSLVVALKMVKDGEADALVSAGNSGAVMLGAQAIVGRKKGVVRAPFAFFIPTVANPTLLLDCGANVDVRAEHLLEFAHQGTECYRNMRGKNKPTVALLNLGEEEEKGNALVKEAYPLLKNDETINFIGFVEPNQLPMGYCDVAVCDGFVGNAVLKMYEGVAHAIISEVKKTAKSSLPAMTGAVMMRKALKKTMAKFDEKQYGGAEVLGLNGLVIKNHGHAEADEICMSIIQCSHYKR